MPKVSRFKIVVSESKLSLNATKLYHNEHELATKVGFSTKERMFIAKFFIVNRPGVPKAVLQTPFQCPLII